MDTRIMLLGRTTRRTVLITLGVVLAGNLLCGVTATAATSMPAGGAISLFVTPDLAPGSSDGTIVIAGAIGDYGTTLSIDKNGATDSNGNFEKITKITLKQGTFEVDGTKLNAMANKLQPTMNTATCSGYGSTTAPVTLFKGTGLYAGISGTVKISETFAFIGPKYTTGAKKRQKMPEQGIPEPLIRRTTAAAPLCACPRDNYNPSPKRVDCIPAHLKGRQIGFRRKMPVHPQFFLCVRSRFVKIEEGRQRHGGMTRGISSQSSDGCAGGGDLEWRRRRSSGDRRTADGGGFSVLRRRCAAHRRWKL